MKVYLPQDMSEVGKKYLTDRGYEIVMGSATDEETMKREIVDCEAVIVRVAKFTEAVMAAAPKLRVIGRHGVGTDNIDLEAARKRGIRVTNGPESNANSVAEHTVGMMVALAHKFRMLDTAVREDQWSIRNTPLRMIDLKDKTVGLVGFGHIAQLVAKKLALGFDMKVITWGSRHPESYPDYVEAADSLEDLFSRSDFISLHCPLKPDTIGMVSTGLLEKMKPTAFLINTSRGEVVDTEALCEALEAGKLAGFAADTLTPEGKPDERLLHHPLTLFTPHCAAHTIDGMNNMALHAAIGVHEIMTGKEPTWPVV